MHCRCKWCPCALDCSSESLAGIKETSVKKTQVANTFNEERSAIDSSEIIGAESHRLKVMSLCLLCELSLKWLDDMALFTE